jgi:hypothetical protein
MSQYHERLIKEAAERNTVFRLRMPGDQDEVGSLGTIIDEATALLFEMATGERERQPITVEVVTGQEA